MTAPYPNLFAPPPEFTLPLSVGGDLLVNFIYKPLVVDGSGDPILLNGQLQFAVANYPSGAVVTFNIAAATPIVATATITGANAVIDIPHATVDPVPARTLWSTVITYTSGINQVMCNGNVVRSDGK